MLVLKRNKDESIVIDDQIKVTVLEIEDGSIKIGIEAPKNIEIHREEVYREIQKENIEAGSQIKDLENLKKIFKKD